MSRIAIATLQTPWDCKWSRFGRIHASRRGPAEGLWLCVHPDATRRCIEPSECETCSRFEYESPVLPPSERDLTTTIIQEGIVAVRPHPSHVEKRLDRGIRIVALALAVLFAGIGFVVLTRPLAIPLTISLWVCALTCFLLGLWGNFHRRSLPVQSW